MAAAGALSVGSTLLKAGGSIAGGIQANRQAKREATAVRADASREAYESAREGQILASNARAASAASGGDAADAGSIERLGEIGRDTDFNSLAAIYSGRNQARQIRRSGRRALISGFVGGGSSILDGAHSFAKGP